MDKPPQQDPIVLRRTLARLGKQGSKVKVPNEMFINALNLNVYDSANLNIRNPEGFYTHELIFVDDYKFITYTAKALIDSDDTGEVPRGLEGKWEEV